MNPAEIDARMGGPPSRVGEDGTRVYSQPMMDGRIRLTYVYPDGREEVFKARSGKPGPIETQLAEAFSPFAGQKKSRDKVVAAQMSEVRSSLRKPAQNLIANTPTATLSGQRKKLIAAGCLCICIASIINESGRYSWGTPSLSWFVLLCTTWALIVWLWPESLSVSRLKRWRRWRCKMKLRKQRNSITQALTNLGLTEALFLESLNKGMNLMNGQLQQNCAAHGWRKMSLQELILAHDALRIMMDMKNRHIRQAEKLIRKGVLSDDGLLELAKERHPGISDWRRMNHTEIDMMICLKTGTLPDWAKS